MIYKDIINSWIDLNMFGDFKFDELSENEKYCGIHTTSNLFVNGLMYEYNHYQNTNNRLLPEFLSHILHLLKGFKTIEDHSKFIEYNQLVEYDQALFCIKELWDLGLVMSQEYYINEITKRDSKFSKASIDTICWISKNRPASLKGSIESYIKNQNIQDYELDYIVFDDSNSNDFDRNKHNIDELNRKYKTRIRQFGKDHQKKLSERLTYELNGTVPGRVIEYGLMGIENLQYKCGANRNTYLLSTTGKYSILSDDDIYCNITKSGENDLLSIISDRSKDQSIRFFKNQDELKDNINFNYHDPVSLHQELLGRNASELIIDFNSKIDLSSISNEFVNDTLKSDKKVRVTMMGVAGDSGIGSPIKSMFVINNNLIQLISDTEDFLPRFKSRVVLQSFENTTIGTPIFLKGMNLGIDNTELLPPFNPNFRNSDGIFASVLRKCFSNCLIGHLPFAISHIPPERREVDLSDLTKTTFRITSALKYSVDKFNDSSTTAQGGLKSLGIHIIEISEKSDAMLLQYFEMINVGTKIEMINHLDYLLKEYDQINKKWTELTQTRIKALNDHLQANSLSIKFDELEYLPYSEQLLTAREVYRNFGELLFYWPEIYHCALSQRDQL